MRYCWPQSSLLSMPSQKKKQNTPLWHISVEITVLARWQQICNWTQELKLHECTRTRKECLTYQWWHTCPGWRSQKLQPCLSPQHANQPVGRPLRWLACNPGRSVEKAGKASGENTLRAQKTKHIIDNLQWSFGGFESHGCSESAHPKFSPKKY